jgi:hypothetical protein
MAELRRDRLTAIQTVLTLAETAVPGDVRDEAVRFLESAMSDASEFAGMIRANFAERIRALNSPS